MYLEETCVVYLSVRLAVGRGLRLEDVSGGNLCCLLNCKAFGWVEGSDSKMYLDETCVVYLIVRPAGGSSVKTRRYILRKLVLLT